MVKIKLYSRYDTEEITKIRGELEDFFEGRAEITDENPEFLIIIGGDGGILAAVQENLKTNAKVIGINQGTVGFLASIDKHHNHLEAMEKLLAGEYKTIKRHLLKSEIIRDQNTVFETYALNEVVISSPLSVVQLGIDIDKANYLNLSGTGVLVATATGSTAFNLSAHGPILSPEVPNLVITELLNHGVPSPSLVIGDSQIIAIRVEQFKRQEQLELQASGEPADVLLAADGSRLFSLKEGDEILVQKSDEFVEFVEFDHQDFYSHLREKFRLK